MGEKVLKVTSPVEQIVQRELQSYRDPQLPERKNGVLLRPHSSAQTPGAERDDFA